ncbi:MAG: hypothetical protein ACI4AA_07775, partial [Lachnospiraceae bacterium]
MLKAVGGYALGSLVLATSVVGIGIAGIPAVATLFTASCSDFVQGCKEIELGCKGDTQTPTNNDLSELLYDGNDGIYHTSTIGASLISVVGGNLVNKKAASVAKKESEKIAKKAAMQPADVVETSYARCIAGLRKANSFV